MTMKISRADWELAELTTQKGGLDRPLDSSELQVPAVVETDGEKLIWLGATTFTQSWVSAGPALLDQFLKLADAPAERIRDYARRWGVLHICEHGMPASHNPSSYSWRLSENPECCDPLGWPEIPDSMLPGAYGEMERKSSGWEPIESWRFYAREAQAILDVAAMLYQNKPGRPEDWQLLTDAQPDPMGPDIDEQQEFLLLAVQRWLLLGDVRPDILYEPSPMGKRKAQKRPRITLGCGSWQWGHLFGALACRLMFAVTRSEGLAICTECGGTYIPKRRLRPEQNHFCLDCGEKAARRHASAAYRARKKNGGRKRKR